ncbi:hypothetical protein [Roseomonas chloroacetimidivorans]|uniref:hypothetical protein n=1 Tax=Roseomonas chloroacetimidivorans TaxID=1766656 RepID=UPI003C731EA6
MSIATFCGEPDRFAQAIAPHGAEIRTAERTVIEYMHSHDAFRSYMARLTIIQIEELMRHGPGDCPKRLSVFSELPATPGPEVLAALATRVGESTPLRIGSHPLCSRPQGEQLKPEP